MPAIDTALIQFKKHTNTFFKGCFSCVKSAQDAASRLLFCKTPDQQGYSELTDSDDFTEAIPAAIEGSTDSELTDSDDSTEGIEITIDSFFDETNSVLDKIDEQKAKALGTIDTLLDPKKPLWERAEPVMDCGFGLLEPLQPPFDLAAAWINLSEGDTESATKNLDEFTNKTLGHKKKRAQK